MANRNVADDASNPNKATIVDNDAFLMRDSESNPNSLKEVLWSLIKSTIAAATMTLTNKTLTTPTIGSFVNATHNHEAAAGGGTLDEDALALTDVTTNNSSTTKHGLLKKLSNVSTEFMNGQGNWATPASSGITSGPQAFTDNFKLSVTVASNNITVAVKTIAGSDPSAGDPVKVRIGDTYRSITAALSVTKNAGTNWFNSGAAELATQEIDYFVYLGYNATDGVVIGFARIPFAHRYDDFSATTTNEKYCAISTITTAAAGDYYENVGRFAATLSAGAGYTWTVPTFTARNLIARPIYTTRNLTWNPTVTAGSGTPTTVGETATYFFDGQQLFLRGHMLVTDKGTAAGSMKLTPPFTVPDAVGFGQEVAVTGVGGAVVSSGNILFITKYDATSPWTNTWDWYFQHHAYVA
jgi:hypothetical protein